MFDNMNNNQNFNNNNGRPLFTNNYNNVENSNGNFGYENNFSTNNNFGYDGVNNSLQVQDLPPTLDGIKNLNEAKMFDAPSLDVLGPANIMPENIAAPNDPLSSYENGNFQFNNNPLQGINDNNMNMSSSLGPNELPNYQFNSSYQTPNLQMNNNFNMPYQGFQSIPNNDFNLPYQMPNSQMSNPQVNNNFNPSYGTLNNSFNNKMGYDLGNQASLNGNIHTSFEQNIMPYNTSNGDFKPPVSNLDMPTSSVEANFNMEAFPLNNSQKNDYYPNIGEFAPNNVPSDSLFLNKEEVNDTNDNYESHHEESKLSNDLSIEKEDYSIVNDSINDDASDKITDLEKLGIEDTYNEPDTIEIMDMDSNEKDSINEESSISFDKISDDVEKIKKLVDTLKEEGAKVELEEFDFESMYQIVIKFSK